MENKRICAIEIILFVVFNIIAFVIPTSFTGTFWVAYGFSIVTFAIELYMWLTFLKNNENAVSQFYHIPIMVVCNIYMVIQGGMFLIFKFFPNIPLWVTIVVNVIIVAMTLIGFITLEGTVDYIETIDEKVKTKLSYIKSHQIEVEMLLDNAKDEELKKILKELIECIRFSDPMSHSSLTDLEMQISENITCMKNSDEDTQRLLVEDTLKILKERNKKCKLLKQ